MPISVQLLLHEKKVRRLFTSVRCRHHDSGPALRSLGEQLQTMADDCSSCWALNQTYDHLTHPGTPTANTEVKLPLNFSRDVRESPQATCHLTVRSLAFPPLLALTLLWCPRSEETPPICLSFFQAFIMQIKRGS